MTIEQLVDAFAKTKPVICEAIAHLEAYAAVLEMRGKRAEASEVHSVLRQLRVALDR